MTNNNYDKRRLIILRAALVLIGAGIGYLALWQYFLYYPDLIRREFQIVITVVSTLLTAAIFGLSAKAVYGLIASVVYALRGLGDRVGARGIVAVLLGFAVAGGLVALFDLGIKYLLDIWAVRLLTDVLAYIFFAAGCCAGFTKWFNAPKADKPTKPDAPAVGYLIAAECFTDERVITAVHTLINAKVCDGAYKALCLYGDERGVRGAKLMDALINSGALTVIHTDKAFDGAAQYAEIERGICSAKRLKRVCSGADEKELDLGVFTCPSDELKRTVQALAESAPPARTEEQKTLPESEQDDVVNGQIIIDK